MIRMLVMLPVLFAYALPASLQAASCVVIVLDDSGSMQAGIKTSSGRVPRIEAAKTAIRVVANQLSDDTQVGIVALNSRGSDGTRWILPLGPLNRDEVRRAVQRIQANGSTPLGEAMKLAGDALLEMRARRVYGDYRLLIVSDGEASDAELVERYLPDIRARGLVVDVIGVDMQQAHRLATRVDRYRRANDHASLEQAIRESLAETAYDPQHPDNEADFALLNALPDDLAMAAIQALATVDNRPIGEGPSVEEITETANHRADRVASPDGGDADDDDRPLRLPFVVTVVVFVIVLRTLIKGLTRRHRHR